MFRPTRSMRARSLNRGLWIAVHHWIVFARGYGRPKRQVRLRFQLQFERYLGLQRQRDERSAHRCNGIAFWVWKWRIWYRYVSRHEGNVPASNPVTSYCFPGVPCAAALYRNYEHRRIVSVRNPTKLESQSRRLPHDLADLVYPPEAPML